MNNLKVTSKTGQNNLITLRSYPKVPSTLKGMNKKGEMTTQQIVTMIILVISFSVILFLIFRLNLGETTNDEICHNSVLLQENTLTGGPLDCRTSYICISGEEDCEDFNYDKKRDVGDKIGAMGIIADEMTKCWWMFGQGEINYVNDFKGTHCAICSIVKLSSDIEDISYEELYKYMEENKTEINGPTYLEYLYGLNSLQTLLERTNKISLEEIISFENKYSIITGMNDELGDEDMIIPPMIVKSDEITTKTKCNVFDITKA